MAKLIPRIVRDFDFSDINSPSKEWWSTTNYFFLKPSNFRVRVKSRTPRAD